MYSFICCYDKKDYEKPGFFKFLKAIQEDTGNNFSYLVPMNIVNICLLYRGTKYPRIKCLKFLKALQEGTGNNSHVSSL